MFRRNEDIRKLKGKIPTWVIAERLGIHENTFYHWMRKEMKLERKQVVMAVIEEIKKEVS
ncbi:hypothetical protein FOA24_32550 [Bacillus thuringiensis]|uniref:hypothetical protein n=1 Tax=Bacillus thuringiensis TaxID=1428 RepID=UPI003337C7E6